MSILLQSPPEDVVIAGVVVPINWDFRTSIKFDILMNGNKPLEEKCLEAILLYYGQTNEEGEVILPVQVLEHLDEAYEKIIWFYSGGRQETGKAAEKVKKGYYFDHDDTYIYAAFMDQYKVDLSKADSMHWWLFKAMFLSLKEDNEICQIIKYRTVKITNKMPREKRDFLRRMREIYAPPADMKDRKELNEIEEKLLNGTF